MKYIKVFTATDAYELQCDVKEYEQNKKTYTSESIL